MKIFVCHARSLTDGHYVFGLFVYLSGPLKWSKEPFPKVLKHHNFEITGWNEANFPSREFQGCGGTTKALYYLDPSLDSMASFCKNSP